LAYKKKAITLQRFNKHNDCFTDLKSKEMKKLVFMFVAMAALSFASCGEKKAAPAEEATDTTEVVDTTVADTTATDTTGAE